MLADAVAPHGGIIMWRAFVYSQDEPTDRAKQAYSEFVPLDGQFRENVVLQVKNGALDFQPREPFHPLFGATPHTPLMLEVQLTKEYLGFATHLVYLAPLFEGDPPIGHLCKGKRLYGGQGHRRLPVRLPHQRHGRRLQHRLRPGTGPGHTSTRPTGTHSARLAWTRCSPPRDIASEWVKMTFSTNPTFVERVVAMMLGSREAAVQLHDSAGPASSDGAHQPLRPGTVGQRGAAGGLDLNLFQPRGCPGHWVRQDGNRQQCGSPNMQSRSPPVSPT